MVKELRADDAKARRIAQAGRRLAQQLLTRPARLCYWKHLLEHIAALQRWAGRLCASEVGAWVLGNWMCSCVQHNR